GIGGHPAEHEAYGIPFPDAEERVRRLEEAVRVLRALWIGGPVSLDGEFYPVRDAYAFPIPEPVPPILVGGETTPGARLAARIGDGWTTTAAAFEKDLLVYLEALEAAGRERGTQRVLVGFDITKRDRLADSPWVTRPAEEAARWEAAGADGAVVMARTTEDVDALIEAAGRR